jgi:hypothetical protein
MQLLLSVKAGMATPVEPKPSFITIDMLSRTGGKGGIDPAKVSAEAPAPAFDRITFNSKQEIDEIVVSGMAHLERMDGKEWFLSLTRKNGSSICVWFSGKVAMWEERPASTPVSPQAPAPWRPIETAPEFAEVILANGAKRVGLGWVTKDGRAYWTDGEMAIEPTHWMPLPPPPQETKP